jgi:hypothetical protein
VLLEAAGAAASTGTARPRSRTPRLGARRRGHAAPVDTG